MDLVAHAARGVGAGQPLDHPQGAVDAREDAGRGDDRPGVDEAFALHPLDLGVGAAQSDEPEPVRGGPTSLEQACVGDDPRTDADAEHEGRSIRTLGAQPVEDLVGAAVDLGDDDDVGRAPELSVELGEGEVGDDVETTGERDRVRGRRDHDRVERTGPPEHLERDEGVGDVGALLTEDDRDDRSGRVDGAGLGQSGRPVAATLAVGSAITAVSPEVARSRCGVDAGGRSRDGDRGRQRRNGQGQKEHDESATQRPQRTVHDPMVRPGGPCHQTFDAHASRTHPSSSRTVDHPRLCTASLNRPTR